MEAQLKDRAGNLGELFGVTRQVAGDISTVLDQSMITAQFPDREEFFRKLASSKELPSTSKLERMWFEIQREMTEQGRVAQLHAHIVENDGTQSRGRRDSHRTVHRDVGWQVPDLSAG